MSGAAHNRFSFAANSLVLMGFALAAPVVAYKYQGGRPLDSLLEIYQQPFGSTFWGILILAVALAPLTARLIRSSTLIELAGSYGAYRWYAAGVLVFVSVGFLFLLVLDENSHHFWIPLAVLFGGTWTLFEAIFPAFMLYHQNGLSARLAKAPLLSYLAIMVWAAFGGAVPLLRSPNVGIGLYAIFCGSVVLFILRGIASRPPKP